MSRGLSLAVVGVSFALAYATYVLVEKPLRFGEFGTFKVAGLSAALAILGVAGIVLPSRLDLDDRSAFVARFENSAPVYKYATTNGLFVLWREECNFDDLVSHTARLSISPQCTAGFGRRVMLWGDSHMQHLAPGLKATVPPQALLLQIATFGCPPSLRQTGPDPESPCNRSNAFALQEIERTKPDVVIVAQRYFHETKDWTELAQSVKTLGAKTVLLLGPVPQWQQPLHAIIARHFWPNPPERLNTWLTPGPFKTDRLLKQRYEHSSDLKYVSIIEGLCNAEGCLTRVGPDLFEDIEAFDYGHLTLSSSKYVAEQVVTPALLEMLHDNSSTTIKTGSSDVDP